jgi:hypothetical protein
LLFKFNTYDTSILFLKSIYHVLCYSIFCSNYYKSNILIKPGARSICPATAVITNDLIP